MCPKETTITTAHPWEVSCGALLIPQEINLAGISTMTKSFLPYNYL